MFIYASKYFLMYHFLKIQSEFCNYLKWGEINWTSCRVYLQEIDRIL